MSRVAKSPVVVPAGVTVDLKTDSVSIKGSNGVLNFTIKFSVKHCRYKNVNTGSHRTQSCIDYKL